ncbi:hypothetical protein Cs7R123_44070 [Catellatospora sp. TT07R-123]|nr:hypothetical protein Cs7R123_44070 [Catellatospora sp. TT07R-123]
MGQAERIDTGSTLTKMSRYAADNGRWLWPVVVACAVVMLVLAVKWMLAVLLATDRLRAVALRTEPDTGEHTTLAAPALEEAVRDQIEAYRGVASAKVRLLGEPQKPIMAVGVRTSAPGSWRRCATVSSRGLRQTPAACWVGRTCPCAWTSTPAADRAGWYECRGKRGAGSRRRSGADPEPPDEIGRARPADLGDTSHGASSPEPQPEPSDTATGRSGCG